GENRYNNTTSDKKVLKLSNVYKLISSSEDEDDFLDKMPESFSEFFYNTLLDPNKWKSQVINLFKRAANKIVVSSGEKASVALGVNQKAVKKAAWDKEAKVKMSY